MGNPAVVSQDEGIIGQAMSDVFNRRDEIEASNLGRVSIELSYVEVYKEEVYDLLAMRATTNNEKVRVDVRETTKGTIIEGLTSKAVTNIETVSKYLSEAAVNRSVGGTAMNSHSSRSHAICTLSIRLVRPANNDGAEEILVSKLNLVDLAGSERAKKTLATGDTFAEGVSINKSLFALGNVVSALADGGNNGFVPYRDSKLTRLLQDALGGNGLTVMLACVSPGKLADSSLQQSHSIDEFEYLADSNIEETLSTLAFASRASSIVNNVHVNHDDNNLDANVRSTYLQY
jgi:kinesin family member 4